MLTRPSAAAALAGATVAVSFSAIFIRLAGDDAATVVWVRMTLSVLLLAPFAVRRRAAGAARLSPRQLGLIAAGGVMLAGHFLLWTASLALTSVAASVLLVSLHPVIVAPLGRRILGEHPSVRLYTGMALTLAGTAATCAGDLHPDLRSLLGDLMAVGGAVCLAGYLLIGRGVRESMSVARYSAIAYATVAIVAAAAAVIGGTPHLPSGRVTLLCLALAAVCTIAGHTVYNWALRHVHALMVSVAFLGEPPLAALLAVLVLGTVPALTTVAGGVLILAGLAVALLEARAGADPAGLVLQQP